MGDKSQLIPKTADLHGMSYVELIKEGSKAGSSDHAH